MDFVPNEILSCILQEIDLVDYSRVLLVCNKWFSIASRLYIQKKLTIASQDHDEEYYEKAFCAYSKVEKGCLLTMSIETSIPLMNLLTTRPKFVSFLTRGMLHTMKEVASEDLVKFYCTSLKGEANALLQQRQIKKSFVRFDLLLILFPFHVDYINLYGYALLNRKCYKEAILVLNKGLEIEPKSFRFHYNKAICYYFLKDWKNAIPWLTMSLEYRPKHIEIHQRLIESLYYMDRFQESKQVCTELFSIDPINRTALYYLKKIKI